MVLAMIRWYALGLKNKLYLVITIITLLTLSLSGLSVKGASLQGANVKTLWSVPAGSNSLNITAAGNVLNNGYMSFVVVNNSQYGSKISLVNGHNGDVMWNVSSAIITEYMVVNISATLRGLLTLTDTGYLTLYNLVNGTTIFHRYSVNTAKYQNGDNFIIEKSENGLLVYVLSEESINASKSTGVNEYLIKASALNIYNGTFLWNISYPFADEYPVSLYNVISPLPSIPGLPSGGVLIFPTYMKNGNIISYINLYNSNGNLIWNVSSYISGSLQSVSIGNYYYSNSYSIAYTTTNGSGSLAVIGITNGTLQYIKKIPYITPILNQLVSVYNFEINEHTLPLSYTGITLQSSEGSSYLLAEYIGIVPSSSGKSLPNSLVALDIANNTVAWRVFLPGTVSIYTFNYAIIPSALTDGVTEIIAVTPVLNYVYGISAGTSGNATWRLNYNFKESLNYFYALSYDPSLYTINGKLSFITASYMGFNHYNLSFYNGINGTLMFNRTLSVSLIFSYMEIMPLSYLSTSESYAFMGIAESHGTYKDFIDGFDGNGSTIFSLNTTGNLELINGTSYYSYFYPGLHNGQLTDNGKIDNFIMYNSEKIYAMELNVSNVTPLKILNFTSVNESGIAPLSDAFYVNVTGGIAPYNYTWSVNGVVYSVTTAPYYNHSFTVSGIYNVSVMVKDTVGNVANSNNIMVIVKSSNSSSNSTSRYYLIEGMVKNSGGLPVSGVSIEASTGNVTTSLSDGEFLIYLPNGTWVLTFIKTGYDTVTTNITVKGGYSGGIYVAKMNSSNVTSVTTGSSVNKLMDMYYVIIPVIVIVMVILIYLFVISRKENKINFADGSAGKVVSNRDKTVKKTEVKKVKDDLNKNSDRHVKVNNTKVVKGEVKTESSRGEEKRVVKNKVTKKTKECPTCGEVLPYESEKCTSCGEQFTVVVRKGINP